MRKYIPVFLFIVTVGSGPGSAADRASRSAGAWQPPLDSSVTTTDSAAALGLPEVLALVARDNPVLLAGQWKEEAARGTLRQAGAWPNPELEAEIEEFGLDAPGWRESEVTLLLSQEFEPFGQRGARKGVAGAGLSAARWQARVAAFDLYLDTRLRFYALVHAQQRVNLARESLQLAQAITEDIARRIEQGAALQSELMLARLESHRASLALTEARGGQQSARSELAALWGGEPSLVTVTADSLAVAFDSLSDEQVSRLVDSSRAVLNYQQEINLTRARQSLAAAEARPSLTLTGGYKRIRSDRSNSLVLGVALPLPLFNRNRGTTASLDAEGRMLEYEREQARLSAVAALRSGLTHMRQLVNRYRAIDTLLLPAAEATWEEFDRAHRTGRIPYTSLLEIERTLIELRFEHADIRFAIREQQVALERLIGRPLHTANTQETER